MRKTKKIAVLGLLTAIALTIFMIEAQIPPVVPLKQPEVVIRRQSFLFGEKS